MLAETMGDDQLKAYCLSFAFLAQGVVEPDNGHES
jgi:hypothetical protein